MQTVPFFSGSQLDRRDDLRSDAAAIEALARQPDARELRWEDGVPVLTETGGLAWGVVSQPDLFLGFVDGEPCFSPVTLDPPPMRASFALLGQLRAEEAPILAAALGLANWHRRHGFCANCGAGTEIIRGGWSRHCRSCAADHFPRVDPVVIMVVEHQGRVLLGRQPHFPPGMFSALAGFIEPGESVEDAVARETLEEAGVAVENVRYIASQPWPFPSSLMIGCFAAARSDVLRIDTKELEEARWFSREEIEQAVRGDSAQLTLPAPYAIARHLLDEWLAA